MDPVTDPNAADPNAPPADDEAAVAEAFLGVLVQVVCLDQIFDFIAENEEES